MFGMIDYRASKLWLLTFKIPLLVANLMVSAATIGFSYYFSTMVDVALIFQFVIGIIIHMVLSFPAWGISAALNGTCKFIFNAIIDVVPAKGRNKTEAWDVVMHGQKAITRQRFLKVTEPEELTYDLISSFAKLDWVNRLFYFNKTVTRWQKVAVFFSEEREYIFNAESVENFMRKKRILPSKVELIVTSVQIRTIIMLYLILGSIYVFV